MSAACCGNALLTWAWSQRLPRSESDRCRVASLVTGAVYAGDTPVGFVMLATEVDEETPYAQYYLWRWMIDQRHQVNTLAGSGRAAAYCQA